MPALDRRWKPRILSAMAARPTRPLGRTIGLLLIAAVSGGCLAGRSASQAAGPVATTTSVSTAVTTASTVPEPTSPVSTAPAGPPFPVATLSLPLVDRSRPTVSRGRTLNTTRALTTTVWFPDRPGRFPLVVFAHGFQVSPSPYTSLLESWAAHGYVVAAPAFPLTDPDVAGPNLDEGDINNQPADVRFVTDQLVAAASPLSRRIDPGRVAVAGHSDGAETALAASTAPAPPGEPAYRAVIVLSGQPVPGAAGHNPPALVVQGDADTINPPDYGYSAWDQAASPKYLLVLRGGGHLPPYEAGSRWLAGVETVSESFLDTYMSGAGSVSSIASAAAHSPGVSLRAG